MPIVNPTRGKSRRAGISVPAGTDPDTREIARPPLVPGAESGFVFVMWVVGTGLPRQR